MKTLIFTIIAVSCIIYLLAKALKWCANRDKEQNNILKNDKDEY